MVAYLTTITLMIVFLILKDDPQTHTTETVKNTDSPGKIKSFVNSTYK